MTIDAVLRGEKRYEIVNMRCEKLEAMLPDGSVDLILTDPPFHRCKKDLAWDREHKTAGSFLDWIGERLAAWRRILAPNGSLYVFASPGMAGRVEGKAREHFNIIGAITWAKPTDYEPGDARATAVRARDAAALRTYFHYSERVIFAEQKGTAIGRAIETARRAAGLSLNDLAVRLGYAIKGQPSRGTGLTRWWEADPSVPGSCYPTREQYEAAMRACGAREPIDYDALMRPFSVSAEVPYTDVWTYPTVNAYPGKHPCEKPPEMALDIVRASSRPGGLTLDLFGGSFVFSAAAVALGRRAIACDMDPAWCEVGRERCRLAEETGQIVTRARRAPKPGMPPESGPRIRQLDLFSGPA